MLHLKVAESNKWYNFIFQRTLLSCFFSGAGSGSMVTGEMIEQMGYQKSYAIFSGCSLIVLVLYFLYNTAAKCVCKGETIRILSNRKISHAGKIRIFTNSQKFPVTKMLYIIFQSIFKFFKSDKTWLLLVPFLVKWTHLNPYAPLTCGHSAAIN